MWQGRVQGLQCSRSAQGAVPLQASRRHGTSGWQRGPAPARRTGVHRPAGVGCPQLVRCGKLDVAAVGLGPRHLGVRVVCVACDVCACVVCACACVIVGWVWVCASLAPAAGGVHKLPALPLGIQHHSNTGGRRHPNKPSAPHLEAAKPWEDDVAGVLDAGVALHDLQGSVYVLSGGGGAVSGGWVWNAHASARSHAHANTHTRTQTHTHAQKTHGAHTHARACNHHHARRHPHTG